MKVSPLGALLSIVGIGVTIEIVEQQNRQAAYVLVVLLLLGVITFNASRFRAEVMLIGAILRSSGGGGAHFSK